MIELAVHTAPSVSQPPSAPPASSSAPSESLESKLEELKRVYDKKLIKQEEYEAKRKQLLTDFK
jgi:hypothetical protein